MTGLNNNSQIVRLGLDKRTMTANVGKHGATNDGHLRQLIARLDASGDKEAADTIGWLVWWNEFYSSRMYEAFKELDEVRWKINDEQM